MNKFKVGDVLIGNERCFYSVTNRLVRSKVLAVKEYGYIRVEVIEGPDTGAQHNVQEKYFKRFMSKEGF